jgi:hypothetical protein
VGNPVKPSHCVRRGRPLPKAGIFAQPLEKVE